MPAVPVLRFAPPVLRFAPSPNGPLHLGHVLSALVGYRMAQRAGGRYLLRIEDIDLTRSREEHIAGIETDLAWLGIAFEQPVLRQSTRFPAYWEAARKLLGLGLLYPCFATRSEINASEADGATARDPDGAPLFPNRSKRPAAKDAERYLEDDNPRALRIDMARAVGMARERLEGAPLTFREIAPDGVIKTHLAHPERWGDAVIVRKEVPASYHLAVVVDDAAQGVTHVTRGQDLLAATGIHRLLQVLLELPEPVYHHHALILSPNGRKLSKSAGASALAALRQAGAAPQTVIAGLTINPPPI